MTGALRFHTELIAAYNARDRVEQLMADHISDAGCIISELEALCDRTVLLKPAADMHWEPRPLEDDQLVAGKS